MKVELSTKKMAANQQNAKKSTGPHDTRSTRYNAAKHGLLSQGITEIDQPESFQALLEELRKEQQPVGIRENEAVKQIAFLLVRLRRCRFVEAEAVTAYLNPASTIHHPGPADESLRELVAQYGRSEVVDPGLPARLSSDFVEKLNNTVLRYESTIENKLFRWENHLERLQRRRQGENLAAPAAVDLNVHHASDSLASFGNPPVT